MLESRLRNVEKAPGDNTPTLAGLLATDFLLLATDFDFNEKIGTVMLHTTHLGMAELFVKIVGLDSFHVTDLVKTRHGGRPRMALRAKPPEELFRQYGRVLEWLAEEGGWEQLEAIVKEGVEMLKKAAGEGDDETRKVDPQSVAEEVVQELRKAYEEAVKEVSRALDYYIEPEEYWAVVAERMAFENPPLTRFFLSWLSMYLWAVEGKAKAVAEFLTAAVMGDGSIQTAPTEGGFRLSGEVTLAVGRFSTDEENADKSTAKRKGAGKLTHIHKAALALGVLAKAGHAPERVYAKVGERSRWFELAWGVDAARGFLSHASLHLYVPELAGSSDEIRIKYIKALEVVGVKTRVEAFAAEGGRPRARLVVRLGGEEAEFSIRLHKNNMIELRFDTTDREEAERKAALLRAVGVRAEVKKKRGRDEWRITITTNALAADSVHEAVRRAVAEFLRLCRDAGAIGEDTYRRLAGKFERGVPE
jgi:hypothetical protein